MRTAPIFIGMLALICQNESACAKDKTINFSDDLQTCLFGDDAKIDSDKKKEALLYYVISELHDEQKPSKHPLVNECITKEKLPKKSPKKVTRSIEISGYDIETQNIEKRDYDISFKFHEGPYVKIPFLGDSIDFEVNMTAFLSVDETEGAEEDTDIRQYGVDIGSVKYNGWRHFKPYLTLGYLNLDERTTNVVSGEVTDPPKSDNAKFLFGADLPISDYVSIEITHEVGFKNGFSDKTLSRTGASFAVEW